MKKQWITENLRTIRMFEFCVLSLVPVSLMTFGLVPTFCHYVVLLLGVIYAGYTVFSRKWTTYDLGLRRDTLVCWRHYAGCTIVSLAVIGWWHYASGAVTPSWTSVLLVKLTIVSLVLSAFQEFVYRSFLFRLFRDITSSPRLLVIGNVVVFTYMHTIFPSWGTIIPLTAAGGVVFALMYQKYPNFYLVTGMHWVLNFAVLYLGYFPIQLLHVP